MGSVQGSQGGGVNKESRKISFCDMVMRKAQPRVR